MSARRAPDDTVEVTADPSEQTVARYAIDIETTGLDPRVDRVTTIAVYSPEASLVVEDADEGRMLLAVQSWLYELEPGELVGWNSAVFDFPFLAVRMDKVGVRPAFELTDDPTIVPKYEPTPGFAGGVSVTHVAAQGRHTHLDVAYAYRAWAAERGVTWSLKPVARACGLDPIEVDREAMDALSVAERMAYGLSDVVVTYELAQLLDRRA